MNKIFKSISFYLSIIGFITVLVLMNLLNKAPPKVEPVQEPPANPYQHSIAASGIIESSDRDILIGVPAPGIVTAVYVNVSDSVNESARLFQIDPRELEASIVELKARLNVAKAQQVRVESQLAKLLSIEDRRAVSQEDVDTKTNDVHVAEAEVLSAEASLKRTEMLLERLTVRAPKAGVILQSNIRKGEYASSNTPAMVLGDTKVLQVRVDIDEQNASHYRIGLPAVAYLKNDPSFKIPLHFSRIEPYVIPKKSLTGASDERVDTRVLQVIYSIDQADRLRFFVGQQVDVFIELESDQ